MRNAISKTGQISAFLRENAALIGTYILGFMLIALVTRLGAFLYLGYCLAATLFYAAWTCPSCPHYPARSCPARFDLLSPYPVRPRKQQNFRLRFTLGVLAVAPAWFAPLLLGTHTLFTRFGWITTGLLVLFLLIGFVLLPLHSRRHCRACTNPVCPRKRL